MNVGQKLRESRIKSKMTQEQVAEKLFVSRQTISNWENEKSYPDIISVIKLSDLYSISLDELLKGDEKMVEHLQESTNVVKSSKMLIGAIFVNIIVFLFFFVAAAFVPGNVYFAASVFSIAVISVAFLMYQIIRKI